MKVTQWIAVALIMTSYPAQAQGILDSLRGLKKTAEQLESTLSGKTGQAPEAARSGQSARGDTTEDGLIGVSELSSDTFDTNLANQPPLPGDVTSFDIRGFKLGMSPREVRRVARKERFRATVAPTTSIGWDARVIEEANKGLSKKLRADPKSIWVGQIGADSLQNSIELRSTLTRAGSVVIKIEYRFRSESQTSEEIQAAAIKKYGQPCRNPNDVDKSSLYWGVCKSGYIDGDYPSLWLRTVGGGPLGNTLVLDYGRKFLEQVSTDFRQDVEKARASSGRKAVF